MRNFLIIVGRMAEGPKSKLPRLARGDPKLQTRAKFSNEHLERKRKTKRKK